MDPDLASQKRTGYRLDLKKKQIRAFSKTSSGSSPSQNTGPGPATLVFRYLNLVATNEEVGDRLNLLMDHVDDIQVQNATQIFKDFINLSVLNI